MGFIERSTVVLPKYKGWSIPPHFQRITKWYQAVKQRKSVQDATADRSEISKKTHAFEATERNEYLLEMYECYSNNEVDLAKQKLKESGKVGFNSYKHFKVAQ